MPTALVTGASGFTGRYLAKKLAASGYEVHGTVHEELDGGADGLTRVHSLDVGDSQAVAAIVDEIRPDKVVHLAAIAFVAHSNVEEMYRTNVLGTRNLLDALANAGNCATTLIASSANVYGNAAEGMIGEYQPPAPMNDYAVTKVASEYVASIYSKRLPLIVVRPFNYTGRGQATEFLVPKIVEHARRRLPQIELGNLDVSRDFSDVRAVTDAYVRLLHEPKAIGGTFNVCSGKALSLREIVRLVQDISGHRMEVCVNPDLVRPDEVRILWGSPERIEQVIGSLGIPPFEDTLKWMFQD